jgi:hypothetical protein
MPAPNQCALKKPTLLPDRQILVKSSSYPRSTTEENMQKTLLAMALACLLAPFPAMSQQVKFETKKQVSTEAGKPVRLALLGRVTPACQNAPVRISIAIKPLNGSVEATKLKMKKGVMAKCPELQPESASFVYTPNPMFKGKDQVAIVVEYEGKRNGELYEITVD